MNRFIQIKDFLLLGVFYDDVMKYDNRHSKLHSKTLNRSFENKNKK